MGNFEFIRRFCLYLFLLTASTTLSSQEKSGFPREMEWNYTVYESDSSYRSRILIHHQTDGTWTFDTISPFYNLQIRTSRSLELIESRGDYFEDRFIQVSKASSFHIRRLSSGPYQCSRMNKNGNEKRNIQELSGALDNSMVKFRLLYLFHLAGTSFNLEMDLFDPGRLRPYRMSFTSSLLSGPEIKEVFSDYVFPESIETILNNSERMILVDGRLAGLPGTIYPHPFVYLMDQDLNLLAEWGGKSEFPYFTYYDPR